MISPRFQQLFDFVTSEVWASSGDGEGIVVVKGADSVTHIAAAFDEWQTTHPICGKWPIECSLDTLTDVTFSRGEEHLTFITEAAFKEQSIPPWVNVIVQIETWQGEV